ncbi:MAG: hypothetical protein ACI3XP_08370 [Eubacteriales bacterium]
MNWIGWTGVFFLSGGALFLAAALSLSRGKQVSLVEAKVIRCEEDGQEGQEDGEVVTEYEFTCGGETMRAVCHTAASVPVGETERLYYDARSGALYHRRLLGSMYTAAALFAAGGILAIVLQGVLG